MANRRVAAERPQHTVPLCAAPESVRDKRARWIPLLSWAFLALSAAPFPVNGSDAARIADPPTTARTASWVIVPGVAIGPIRLGMSDTELGEVLGIPEHQTDGAWGFMSEAFTVIVNEERRQVVAVVAGTTDPGARDVARRFGARTPEGIGIGSTRGQLVAAHGEPSRGDVQGPWETMTYKHIGLEFFLYEGEIVNFAFRSPARRGT